MTNDRNFVSSMIGIFDLTPGRGANPGMIVGAALIVAVACLLILVSIMQSSMLINTGDYFRVTRFVVDTPLLSEPASCYKFHMNPRLPSSAMGAVFMLTAGIHKLLGLDCVYGKSSAYLLYFLFVVGIVLSLRHSRENYKLIVPFALLALLFSPLMSSYYEEAALFALMPWMIWGTSRLRNDGKPLVFIAMSVLMVSCKAQMVFFMPLLIYMLFMLGRRKNVSRHLITSGILLIVLLASATNFVKGRTNAGFNAYNRYFNGIGWSLQDVVAWPANNFSERYVYFYKGQEQLQQITASSEPLADHKLLGTGYWPTGQKIYETSSTEALRDTIKSKIRFADYLAQLAHPRTFYYFVKNVYGVFISSDYSLGYLHWKTDGYFWTGGFEPEVRVLGRFGVIFTVVLLTFLIINRPVNLIFVGYVVLMPMAIVVGDGFYDFEKHIATFLLASPLFLLYLASRFAGDGKPVTQPTS